MMIRDERTSDVQPVRDLVRLAFALADHASGTEQQIIDELRLAGALTLSLVAEDEGAVIGHVAISPVSIGSVDGWYGLGPVAVDPQHQRKGVGALLIGAALDRLREVGAAGCVVLGDPGYYGRFGFAHDPQMAFADAPPPYFQAISFGGPRPSGTVTYHPAFTVAP
nr:N-acetyltransferase [uncultured Sphingomonas sp.]